MLTRMRERCSQQWRAGGVSSKGTKKQAAYSPSSYFPSPPPTKNEAQDTTRAPNFLLSHPPIASHSLYSFSSAPPVHLRSRKLLTLPTTSLIPRPLHTCLLSFFCIFFSTASALPPGSLREMTKKNTRNEELTFHFFAAFQVFPTSLTSPSSRLAPTD